MLRLSLAVLILAPAASAQSILHTFDGDSAGDRMGHSVGVAGDVNGDGVVDLIVGMHHDDNQGPGSGSARVFSGLDGSVLHTFDGGAAGDELGIAVGGARDVDGDGLADLIVGLPGADPNGPDSGSARVLSGLDGSLLHVFHGDSAGDRFGTSVAPAGDVDGDGIGDLIVGAPRDDPNGTDSGSARVLSGRDGSLLHVFHGDSTGDRFGQAVGGAGDVNGDGFDDLIVGAEGDDGGGNGSGGAQVFSGLDGSRLYAFVGDGPGDGLGSAVGGAGDVNRDGLADLIVGAPSANTAAGLARVFSGLDGAILHTFVGGAPGDALGTSVASAGDVDGDGFADLVVGAPFAGGRGGVRVFSGVDGSRLRSFRGESPGDRLGEGLGRAGDVNGDGFADLILGAPGDDHNGVDSGRARVVSGCDALGRRYCTPAAPSSSGGPGVIRACGSTAVALDDLSLAASDLPRGRPGTFLVSRTRGFLPHPGGSQGHLCLGGAMGRFPGPLLTSGPGGSFGMRVDLGHIPVWPPRAVQPGETWFFQAWFRDRNPGPTSNFTDALAVTFE